MKVGTFFLRVILFLLGPVAIAACGSVSSGYCTQRWECVDKKDDCDGMNDDQCSIVEDATIDGCELGIDAKLDVLRAADDSSCADLADAIEVYYQCFAELTSCGDWDDDEESCDSEKNDMDDAAKDADDAECCGDNGC